MNDIKLRFLCLGVSVVLLIGAFFVADWQNVAATMMIVISYRLADLAGEK